MTDHLIIYRSADPWPQASARDEQYVDDLLDQHLADAAALRVILTDAYDKIARLGGILTWPIRGYDLEGTLNLLRDLTPPVHLDAAAMHAAEDAAWDMVKDVRA